MQTDKLNLYFKIGILLILLYVLNKVFGKSKEEINAESINEEKETNPFSPKYWKARKGAKLLTTKDATNKVEALWDATGFFNDDEEEAYSVFRTLTHKTQVSFMADRFMKLKGKSLIDFLNEHFSEGELSKIYDIVDSLK